MAVCPITPSTARPAVRRRLRRAGLGLALAVCLLLPDLAGAASPLQVLEYAAGKRLEQVWVHGWPTQGPGGRALSVVLRATDTSQGPQRELRVLRPEAKGWQVLGAWPLEDDWRYLEPLRLPTGIAWLAFDGAGWRLLTLKEGRLMPGDSCACPSVFSRRWGPSRTDDRFVWDLDGDGLDEVLLPAPEGIGAFRPDAVTGTLHPLWGSTWTPEGTPLAPDRDRPERYDDRPRLWVRPLGLPQGGQPPPRALLLASEDTVWSLTVPAAAPAPGTVLRPVQNRLEGLPPAAKDTVRAVHALEDMDGDGLPDLLHFATLNADNVLSQQTGLRWYPGRLEGGTLRLDRAARTLTSDGGSFADLLRLHGPQRPPHLLLVAKGEVSLGSVMRLLATKEATFKMELHAWQPGSLSKTAEAAGALTLKGLDSKGPRPALLPVDLDGNGQRAVLVNTNAGELSAFAYRPGQPLFGAAPVATGAVALPVTDDTRFVTDADGDGREELILWHRKGAAKERETLRTVRLAR